MHLPRLLLPACLLVWLLPAGSALATSTGVTDPGRIDRQLDIEPALPAPLTAAPLPAPTQPEILPGASETRLFVKDLRITGVSVYPAAVFDAMAAELEGREVSVADIARLAARITDHYRQNGYVLAQAFLPPQRIADGIVEIRVIEPFIAQVVKDGPVPPMQMIDLLLAPWLNRKVLHVGQLEETLLRLNDLPGVEVQSVLEPQPESTQPGALVLRLVFTEEAPLSARLSLDNYGSKFIGPYQAGISLGLSNAFWHTAQTDLNFFVASQLKELVYGSISHRIPLPHPGLSLAFGAGYSQIVPGYTLKENDITGVSHVLSLELTQSLLRSRQRNFEVAAMFEKRVSVTRALNAPFSEDRLSVVALKADYQSADLWRGFNVLGLELRQGLDILDTRKTGSDDLSRLEGRSDFTSLNVKVSRLQQLSERWSLFGSFRGQYAFQPLLSSEEFGYGGSSIGRAYNASEIVGDHGVALAMEARYLLKNTRRLTLQPYAFYDFGKVWNLDDLDRSHFSGASAGLGLRGEFSENLAFDAFAAKPLTRSIETPQFGSGKNMIFKFSVHHKF